MKRSWLISNVLFRNIDPIVMFGIIIGLIGGLGVAVGGNLLIRHIMDSYQQFLQRSLIGVQGSLRLETATPLAREFRLRYDQLDQAPASYAWYSPGPIRIELKQEGSKWKRQVNVIILNKQYLLSKMAFDEKCMNFEGKQTAYGNDLLFKTLVNLNLDKSLTLEAEQIKKGKVNLSLSPCTIDTGMMTKHPILFISWELLDFDPLAWRQKIELEFCTRSQVETEETLKTVNKILYPILDEWAADSKPLDHLFFKPPINLFDSKEMKLALQVSQQANIFSMIIIVITGLLSCIILAFGFSLLLELKRKVITIISNIGVSTRDVSLGFMFRGFRIGLYAAVTGVIIALLVKQLVIWQEMIPFENFFITWNIWQIVGVLIGLPIIVALFSLGIVYTILGKQP